MSMGTKLPSEIFNPGYTQPYGSGSAANMYGGGFGGGTYDPMLGFGQASGMGTTYDYPTRYSADYTRYAQSGQPFNQPVMGYNSYGQIFAQPQRPPPSFGKGGGGFRPPQPPAMGGKGGGGFQPGYGYQPPQQPPQQPPTMGGKGGSSRVKDESDYVTISYPGGSRRVPRFPERRSNQLGLTGGPGATPPPLTGGVPSDSNPVRTDRPFSLNENIYNSPFGQLFGGLGGMPSGTQVTNPNQFAVSTADRRYDPTTGTTGPSVTRYFENPSPSQPFNFGQGFGRMAFQEGGQVPPDANMEMMMTETAQPEMAGEYDRLIQMTMQAILGQVESPDEIIQMFIDEFGVDAFRQLRDAVLKQQVPGAQTEGMVDGNGGGMDDQVMGMIGNQRPVAVSPGEYIVPADVVSGLGDGSSQAGADILDELNQAVRMTRTGTTQQPRPLMETLQQ